MAGRRRLKNHVWFKTFGPVPKVPCYWCRRMLLFDEATVDHEPALAEGGSNRNVVIACSGCNHKRGIETYKRTKHAGH